MRPINELSVILCENNFKGSLPVMASAMEYNFTGESLFKHLRRDDDDPATVARIWEVNGQATYPYIDILSGKGHQKFHANVRTYGFTYKKLTKEFWPHHGFSETPDRIHELENFYTKRIMNGWLFAAHCHLYRIPHPKPWLFEERDGSPVLLPKTLAEQFRVLV